MQYIYLHGFASSPNSAKAKYIFQRFGENQINLEIPDLNSDDFSHTLITEPHAIQEYTVKKILNNPMHFLHIKNCVTENVYLNELLLLKGF